MRKLVDFTFAVLVLFVFALMIDMAIVGITPAELYADIRCLF